MNIFGFMEADKKKFRIKNNELLKRSLGADSTKSIPLLVRDSVEQYGAFFLEEKLEITDKEDTIYRAFKNGFFTKTIFNSFLCCLFDGADSENSKYHIKHNLDDFINFYYSLETPETALRKSDIKKYNAVLRRLVEKSPHLNGIHFNMNANWRIIKQDNNIETSSPTNPSSIKKYLTHIIIALVFIFFALLGTKILTKEPSNPLVIRDKLTYFDDCSFPSDSLLENKIIILPFNNIIDNTQRFDYGYVIATRLDSLNKADSLNLNVTYCKKIKTSSVKREHYDQIRKSKNADHILYGFVEPGKSSKDNLTINNISDFQLRNNKDVNSIYGQFKQANLMDINKGLLQKNFENNLYFNITIICMRLGKYEKALNYIRKLTPIDKNGSSKIHHLIGEIYKSLYLDDRAMINYSIAKDANPKNAVSYARYGNLLAHNGEYKLAEYYLTKALSQDVLITDWIYSLYYSSLNNGNIKVGAENISKLVIGLISSNQFKTGNKSELIRLMYLVAIAKKDSKDINGYNKQLEFIRKYSGSVDKNYAINLKVRILFEYEDQSSERRRNRLKLFAKNYSKGLNDKANEYLRQIKTFDNKYIKFEPYLMELDGFDKLYNNNYSSRIYLLEKIDNIKPFLDFKNNNPFLVVFSSEK